VVYELQKMKNPRITLVGAGPGDPDLLSVAGQKALKRADVVLYDALVNKELLRYTPDACKHIFVGKRLGQHQYHQDTINMLLVEQAKMYGHVVRLKGGDPYVFGRGNEELRFAKAMGIGVSVIPGASSAIALADLAEIPLLHPCLSDNYWVITASTKRGQLSGDILRAALIDTTVVVLMGVHHLPAIVDIYKQAGKEHVAVAIIQDGSLPQQKIIVGKVCNIEQHAEQMHVCNPAIIIIGPNVESANT